MRFMTVGCYVILVPEFGMVGLIAFLVLLIFQSKNVKGAESVKVVVRCRPMDQKEIKDGHERYAVGHRSNELREVSGETSEHLSG